MSVKINKTEIDMSAEEIDENILLGIDDTDPFGLDVDDDIIQEELKEIKKLSLKNDKQLTPEQIKQFKDSFNLFDMDGDGFITAKELSLMMKCMGRDTTIQQAEKMIMEVDENKNGTVEFDEFLVMAGAYFQLDKGVNLKFEDFDKDGDGFITKDEIAQTMKKIGVQLTDKQIQDMINEADEDNDGVISYQEFVIMMMKIEEN
eukprot:TRINITY_DN1200_c2_g3_i1.p1 TRINITY_DN1200_c2_g3~~TRINITY_DN1200_c2_g3_i1.p1  ORF type:complete len:203 (-),score=90.66 TRINITY_DN1200_c2_g3_i1:139-747(-)